MGRREGKVEKGGEMRRWRVIRVSECKECKMILLDGWLKGEELVYLIEEGYIKKSMNRCCFDRFCFGDASDTQRMLKEGYIFDKVPEKGEWITEDELRKMGWEICMGCGFIVSKDAIKIHSRGD